MPANIEVANGRASFVSHEKPAWHGLGTIVEDEMSLADALRLSGADYEVRLAPVFVHGPDGMVELDDDYAVVRTHPEDGQPVRLGMVGKRYEVVQNADAFDVMQPWIDLGATVETMGVLGVGERAFASVNFGRDLVVAGSDRTELYGLVVTDHRGWASLILNVTPVRVVCSNTLNMALGDNVRQVKIRHTESARKRLEEARDAMEAVDRYAAEWQDIANRLADVDMSLKQFDNFLAKWEPIPSDATDRVKVSRGEVRDQVRSIYTDSPTNKEITGTRWGAYNAVAEWVDHVRPMRGQRLSDDLLRGEAIITGKADAPKDRALALLTR